MRAFRVGLLLALAACCAATVAAAGSASAAARGRHVQLGVLGDPGRFDALTRQHTSSRLIIIRWGQGMTPQYFAQLFASMSEEPILGIGNGPYSPAAIANGKGDAFLVALNAAVAAFGTPIYVRPLAEMNGWWNAYSAFSHDGSSRGAAYSTKEFRKAFARIYLILHGKPTVNGKLAQLGLPHVRSPLPLVPAPNVKVIWNPQGFGSPDLPGNSAAAYYPGNAFADVVADDLYDLHGKAEWPAADALYRAHPHKPFAFGEWGLWGIDDPSFVRTMAQFVRTHTRTVLISYFNGKPGSTWDLGTKPRSRAAYRELIAPLGR